MQPNNNPAFFGIKVSKPGVPVTQATPNQLVYSNNFSTTTWYDSQNSRILEGLLPDGTYGMWVSQPGQNVTTATTNQLIFSSGFQLPKVVWSFTDSVEVPGGISTSPVTYTHNLGFVPFLLASGTATTTSGLVFFSFSFGASSVAPGIATVINDLNSFTVDYLQFTNASVYNITYNLLTLTNTNLT